MKQVQYWHSTEILNRSASQKKALKFICSCKFFTIIRYEVMRVVIREGLDRVQRSVVLRFHQGSVHMTPCHKLTPIQPHICNPRSTWTSIHWHTCNYRVGAVENLWRPFWRFNVLACIVADLLGHGLVYHSWWSKTLPPYIHIKMLL